MATTTSDERKADLKHWWGNLNLFISHSSSFKENWDFLIMITACWNVFILPISIAFEVSDDTTDIINAFVDWCFIMDIIVVFRTTILDDESGEEIRNWRIIANTYLKGRFTIDFLSTLPFDSIAIVSYFLHSLIFFPPNRCLWMNNLPSNSSYSVS